MAHHKVKTDAPVFKDMEDLSKDFEIRYNDRNYQEGDTITSCETVHTGLEMSKGAPLIFTGKEIDMDVAYILHGPIYGLLPGWIIMSVFITDIRV